MAQGHQAEYEIPKAAPDAGRVHGAGPLVDRLGRDQEVRSERERAVVSGFDDHDLDQDLQRPDVELLHGLLQDIKVSRRGTDQERVR